MKTVRKALALLRHFTVATPQWGLSDLARAADLDKATTLRLLRPLVDERLLEQDATTRKYRLGHLVLNLARTREASFPLTKWIQPELERLAQELGEVAHASMLGAHALTTIAVAQAAQRATRVFVDPSEPLPCHATASGMVCLAFGEPAWREVVLSRGDFVEVTAATPHTLENLMPYVNDARVCGYAITRDTFEEEVTGVAVPFFDERGFAKGAIAMAAPTSRVDDSRIDAFVQALKPAACRVTAALGGTAPSHWLTLFKSP